MIQVTNLSEAQEFVKANIQDELERESSLSNWLYDLQDERSAALDGKEDPFIPVLNAVHRLGNQIGVGITVGRFLEEVAQ